MGKLSIYKKKEG